LFGDGEELLGVLEAAGNGGGFVDVDVGLGSESRAVEGEEARLLLSLVEAEEEIFLAQVDGAKEAACGGGGLFEELVAGVEEREVGGRDL